MTRPPLIGCTTYHKTVDQNPPLEVFALMPSYVRAIQTAGGLPVLIPLGLSDAELEGLFERLDGVLLPGGGDVDPTCYGGRPEHPTLRDIDEARDHTELRLARLATARQKPLLAICRGLQVFNVALGGTLWEDIRSDKANAIAHDYFRTYDRDYLAHEVTVKPGSRLEAALQADCVRVNSLHHQGIRHLAPELTASALAPDNLIEAVEVSGHPYAVGVQWHPENLLQVVPQMLGLFTGLVQAAGNGHI